MAAAPPRVEPEVETPATPSRQDRKEQKAAERRERREAKLAARRQREAEKAEQEAEREHARDDARRAKEQAKVDAKAAREKSAEAGREADAEAKARRAAEQAARQAAEREKRTRTAAQALESATAAAAVTTRIEPDDTGTPSADQESADEPSSVEIPADDVTVPAAQTSTTASDDRRAQTAARITDRHDRDAARASAAAERSRAKDQAVLQRAEAKIGSRSGADARRTAKADSTAAAAERQRAKQEERQRRSDAKRQAKAAKVEAKNRAKAEKAEAKQQAQESRQESAEAKATEAKAAEAKAAEAEAAEAKAAEAKDAEEKAAEAKAAEERAAEAKAAEKTDVRSRLAEVARQSRMAAGAAAGVRTVEPDVSRPTQSADGVDDSGTDTSTEEAAQPAAALHEPAPDREPELESTQPIGRVQVAETHETPAIETQPEEPDEPAPARNGGGLRSVWSTVAGGIGVLGLVLSVVLAVGAFTVAIGAGAGNAIYDPISAVCNALAGPLKSAFDFSGPNAASREEFLGWGAGSLIYLALSFAGQAAHRAAIRD